MDENLVINDHQGNQLLGIDLYEENGLWQGWCGSRKAPNGGRRRRCACHEYPRGYCCETYFSWIGFLVFALLMPLTAPWYLLVYGCRPKAKMMVAAHMLRKKGSAASCYYRVWRVLFGPYLSVFATRAAVGSFQDPPIPISALNHTRFGDAWAWNDALLFGDYARVSQFTDQYLLKCPVVASNGQPANVAGFVTREQFPIFTDGARQRAIRDMLDAIISKADFSGLDAIVRNSEFVKTALTGGTVNDKLMFRMTVPCIFQSILGHGPEAKEGTENLAINSLGGVVIPPWVSGMSCGGRTRKARRAEADIKRWVVTSSVIQAFLATRGAADSRVAADVTDDYFHDTFVDALCLGAIFGVSITTKKITCNIRRHPEWKILDIVRDELKALNLDVMSTPLTGAHLATLVNTERAIMEAMRLDVTVGEILHVAPADFEETVGGEKMKFGKGCPVGLSLQAAYTDERQFPEPGQFRMDRPMNDYLHFNGRRGSPRHCLGHDVAISIVKVYLCHLACKQ